MATRGRKPAEFDLAEVERLASRGLTQDQIASALGYDRSTLYKHKALNADLADAVKRGRNKGVSEMANAMFEAGINGGNTAAMIFWMKNNAGWRDKIEHSGDEEKPIRTEIAVNFKRPEGLTGPAEGPKQEAQSTTSSTHKISVETPD